MIMYQIRFQWVKSSSRLNAQNKLWLHQMTTTTAPLGFKILVKTYLPMPHLDALSSSVNQYDKLFADFPDIATTNFIQSQNKHGAERFIPTSGPPVHAQTRCLSPYKLAAVKAEFERMEVMGIIHWSSNPWASPLHMVPKASGGWCPCGASTMQQSPTCTPHHIFKISLPILLELPSYPK